MSIASFVKSSERLKVLHQPFQTDKILLKSLRVCLPISINNRISEILKGAVPQWFEKASKVEKDLQEPKRFVSWFFSPCKELQ